MSRIRANQITNKGANGAPNFPHGLTVTGLVTATTLSSNITGDLTVAGDLGVGGTITYEDVARVDAVGLSTFREGFGVGPLTGIALTAYKDGSIRTSGIITASTYYGSGANLTGIDATKIITGNTQVQTIDTGSDGHVKVLTEGAERLRIDTAGRLLIGKTSGDCKVDIDSTHYVLTSSGKSTTGINIDGSSGNANEYGGGISFQCGATGAAAVAALQDGSDADVVGLAFFTHPGTTGSDDAVERLRIDSSGNVIIGSTTEGHADADNLTVASSARTGITLRSASNDYGNIYFSDGTSGNAEYAGYIQYSHTANTLLIGTNATDQVRFGASGEIGVRGGGSISYGNSGQFLRSGGSSAAPQWASVNAPEVFSDSWDTAGTIANGNVMREVSITPTKAWTRGIFGWQGAYRAQSNGHAYMRVQVSTNNGSSWGNIATYGSNTPAGSGSSGWNQGFTVTGELHADGTRSSGSANAVLKLRIITSSDMSLNSASDNGHDHNWWIMLFP